MTADYGDRPGAAPACLFLHGLGGTRSYFEPTINRLPVARRALTWSLPGYDASPPVSPVSFAGWADAAAGVLDDAGIPAAVVIGHSLGGMIAQELWVRHPDRVLGLVLVATSAAFGGDRAFRHRFLEQRLAPIEAGRTPADIAATVIDGLVAAPLDEASRAHAIDGMSRIEPNAYAAAIRCLTTFDRRATLETITVPTLVIAGSRDRTAPPAGLKRMCDAIPDSEYAEVDCGHLVDLEQGEAFARTLHGFLSRRWPQP